MLQLVKGKKAIGLKPGTQISKETICGFMQMSNYNGSNAQFLYRSDTVPFVI